MKPGAKVYEAQIVIIDLLMHVISNSINSRWRLEFKSAVTNRGHNLCTRHSYY